MSIDAIMNPYFCDPDVCEKAQSLISSGATEKDVMDDCVARMREMANDPEVALSFMTNGVFCGQEAIAVEAQDA